MLNRGLLAVPLLAAFLLLHAANPPEALSSAATHGVQEGRAPQDAPGEAEQNEQQHCRVCRAAERAGLTLTPLHVRPRTRCGGPATYPLWATAPRGRVRPRDLERLRVDIGIDIDEAFLEDAQVEVRCGQALLGAVRVPGDAFINAVSVPRALRERLRGLRGRVTWGATNAQGSQARAGVWIDPPSAEERRAIQALHAALEGEPGWMHDVLEAQLLLDQEFDQAALGAAKAVLARRSGEPHAAAILQAAYTYLGLQDLPEAFEHEEFVARPLHEARREVGHRCHLDRKAARVRSRERRPLGGC